MNSFCWFSIWREPFAKIHKLHKNMFLATIFVLLVHTPGSKSNTKLTDRFRILDFRGIINYIQLNLWIVLNFNDGLQYIPRNMHTV